MEKFIESKSWLSALQTGETKELIGPDELNTPMRDLIKHYPKLAEKVLNKCHQHRINLKDNNETNLFIFELLEDTQLYIEEGKTHAHIEEYQRKTKMKIKKIKNNQFEVPYTRIPDGIVRNHPLKIIVDYKQKNLLSHKVTKKLINYKWDQFAGIFYYANLLYYMIFLAALTTLVLTSMDQNPVNYPKVFQCSDYFKADEFPNQNVSYIFKDGTRNRTTNSWNMISMWTVVLMVCLRFLVLLVGYELRYLIILGIRVALNTLMSLRSLGRRMLWFCTNSNQLHERSGDMRC